MSYVHAQIASNALAALPSWVAEAIAPFTDDLERSSTYPDVFADTAMSPERRREIDPDADRLVYPPPPGRGDQGLPNVGWATHCVWAEPRLDS